jgi:hypothetical protein
MENDIRDNPGANDEMTTVDGAASLDPANPKSTSVASPQTADRIPWVGEIAQPTAVMAVVDSNGHLVPLHTAGDLLRAFKTIWHATED